MIKFLAPLVVLVLSTSLTALAQSGPAQLEGPAGKQANITTYTDSDGKQRGIKLSVTELAFPIRVFEETPTRMARIRHGDVDYWVAMEDFRVNRAVNAECNIVAERVPTGAGRGANEGCVGTKRK